MTSSSPLSGPSSDSLWQNSAFIRLWVAQILSKAGSEITRVALPLTAVIILAATPAQMAALRISGSLPNLLFGLFTGVFVDRTRRGPILVGADIGRALLLGTIPLAALLGRLTFIHLVIVVFLSATLTLFFTLGSVSILPSLVKREQLVEANSRLAFSDSVLGIAGPAAAGWLVQLISAPKAIIVDTVSYLLSALSLRGMRAREASPKQAAKDGAVSSFIIPMAGLIETPPLIIIGVGQALSGIGATIFGINQMSIRQHLIPTDRFGRATAARRFLIFGLAAAGAALGGYLGTVFGLRSTLFAGAVGFSLGFLLLFLSPVRQIRNLSA
jgi:hypothetical protein